MLCASIDFGKRKIQSPKQTWWGFSATAKEDATDYAESSDEGIRLPRFSGRQVTRAAR